MKHSSMQKIVVAAAFAAAFTITSAVCSAAPLVSPRSPCGDTEHLNGNRAEPYPPNIRLHDDSHILSTIIRNNYAYILATSTDNQKEYLHLYQATLRPNGTWESSGGIGIMVEDRPWRLFGRHGKLGYHLAFGQQHGEAVYHFDWCVFGYTTDETVTNFRIRMKDGFIPMEPIHGRYFMRVLTEDERQNFVEVEGLNSQGEVIQRADGEWEDKPRQWSPRHSELYE